tara:strand:- start:410 stop:1078 length:669 start_codon:yes stop_codon:yes gene_type:complete
MKKSGIYIVYFLLVVLLTGFAFKRKSNILIIGDSISIGYTPFVADRLKKSANVTHNPGNAQHTFTGLLKIREWLNEGEHDIIIFNWGLWDLCYRNPESKEQGHRDKINGKLTTSPNEYAVNLDSLVRILREYVEVKLYFVTTTYVPENEAGRYKADAIIYNQVAKEVMYKNGIEVIDLYQASIDIHQKYGKGSGDVHYNEQGYSKLGDFIAGHLKSKIQKLK